MRMIVTGASGELGKVVVSKLRENHQVVSIDQISSNTRVDFVGMDVADPGRFLFFVKNNGPFDAVIHLAEIASIDVNLHGSMYHTNIVGTHHVLRTCAITSTKCIMPVWMEPAIGSLDHPVVDSLVWKRSLIKWHNIGNTIVIPIELPRLICSKYPVDTWSAYLSRFVSMRLENRLIIGDDEEISDQPLYWIPTNFAADFIIESIHRRTRESLVPLHLAERASINDIFEILLESFDLESVEVTFQHKYPRTFRRNTCAKNKRIRTWIETEIEGLVLHAK